MGAAAPTRMSECGACQLLAAAALGSLNQSLIGGSFRSARSHPGERELIKLPLPGGEALAHALHQAPDLVVTTQRLVLGGRGQVGQDLGLDDELPQRALAGGRII